MVWPGLLVARDRNSTHSNLRNKQMRICFLTHIWKFSETIPSGMARSRVSTIPTRTFLSLFFLFFFLYFPVLLRHHWHITFCKLLSVSQVNFPLDWLCSQANSPWVSLANPAEERKLSPYALDWHEKILISNKDMMRWEQIPRLM